MAQVFINNFSSSLNGGILAADTTLQLPFAVGEQLPDLSGGDHFFLTIATITDGKETAWELVKVTARFGDLLSIERAQENTVAADWPSGATVAHRLTAGMVTAFQTAADRGPHAGVYLPLAGGAMTGPLTSTSSAKAQRFYETVVNVVDGTSINLNNGNVFHAAPSENKTYTFDNPPASGTAVSFTLEITPSAAVAINWPASVVWVGTGNTAPAAPASGDVGIYTFYTRDGGTTWYGFVAGEATP